MSRGYFLIILDKLKNILHTLRVVKSRIIYFLINVDYEEKVVGGTKCDFKDKENLVRKKQNE